MFALLVFGASFAAYADETSQLQGGGAIPAEVSVAYALGSGDELRITVFGEPNLSGPYTISDTGVIAVPLIGDVGLGGLDLRAAEQLIIAKLSDGYLVNPSVSLEIAAYRPFYILGEVRRPGSYNYVDQMTVLKAVAMAGGLTYRARQSRVKIKHGDGAEKLRETSAKINPGDVIMVEERFF